MYKLISVKGREITSRSWEEHLKHKEFVKEKIRNEAKDIHSSNRNNAFNGDPNLWALCNLLALVILSGV